MTERWHPGNPGPHSKKLDMKALAEGGAIQATKPKRKRDRSNVWLFLALLAVMGWLFGLEISKALGN